MGLGPGISRVWLGFAARGEGLGLGGCVVTRTQVGSVTGVVARFEDLGITGVSSGVPLSVDSGSVSVQGGVRVRGLPAGVRVGCVLSPDLCASSNWCTAWCGAHVSVLAQVPLLRWELWFGSRAGFRFRFGFGLGFGTAFERLGVRVRVSPRA